MRRESYQQTGDQKESPHPGSGRVRKGVVNVPETGTGACKSRTTSNVCKETETSSRQATTGTMVRKAMAGAHCKPKTMPDASVWTRDQLCWSVARARFVPSVRTGCARDGHALALPRSGEAPVRPGVQSSTYRATGLLMEHGNPESGARAREALANCQVQRRPGRGAEAP